MLRKNEVFYIYLEITVFYYHRKYHFETSSLTYTYLSLENFLPVYLNFVVKLYFCQKPSDIDGR